MGMRLRRGQAPFSIACRSIMIFRDTVIWPLDWGICLDFISWRISGSKCKSQRVGAVLINNLQRIYSVAKRFRHLASLSIPYKTMNKHMRKRYLLLYISGKYLAHIFKSHENHFGYPESYYIICCNKYRCRIKIIKFAFIVRPPES